MSNAPVSLKIERIYLKDASFESPASPEIFRGEWHPELGVDINTRGSRLTGDVHEVVLSATVTSKLEDGKNGFLVEIKQAGIFSIEGANEEQLSNIMGVVCPNVLFPYLRETLDSLLVKGGFPAVQLAPINFDALYSEAMKSKADSVSGPNGPVGPKTTTH